MGMEHFSTRTMPAERRRGYWRDLVAETFPGMTVRADEGIRADLSRWALGRVGMAVARSERSTVSRTPANSAERHVVLHLQGRGRLALSQCGRTAIAPAGSIAIVDDAEPYVIDVSDRNECFVFHVPVSALGTAEQNRDWRATILSGRDANVALLRRMIKGLWAEADRHDMIDAGFDAVLLSMVRIACGSATPPNEKEADCLPPVAFALRALCDPMLNTAAIADGTGMSERGVQKAFLREVGQTPMAFVVDRRLARAAEMLARNDGRSITEIAFGVGFNDSASFSRCFRRRYDETPSRWAARAR